MERHIPSNSVVISFEDPDNEIDDPVLAITYSFTSTGTGGTVNGTSFDGYTRAAIKFQNAADLPASSRQSLDFTRILTHEVGHSIGLRTPRPTAPSSTRRANIMYRVVLLHADAHAAGVGARRLAGLVFLYPTDRSCNSRRLR